MKFENQIRPLKLSSNNILIQPIIDCLEYLNIDIVFWTFQEL